MIHVQPQIKNHPAQGGTIPTFPRSHPIAPAEVPHRPVAPPLGPVLASVFTHEQLAERAYDIYVKSGRREEKCQQNWAQAENDLRHQGSLACHSEHVMKDVFSPDANNAG